MCCLHNPWICKMKISCRMIMSVIYFAEHMHDMSRHLLQRNGVLSQVPRQSRLKLWGNVICVGQLLSLVWQEQRTAKDLGPSGQQLGIFGLAAQTLSISILWKVDWIIGLYATFQFFSVWQPESSRFLEFVEQNALRPHKSMLVYVSTLRQVQNWPFPWSEKAVSHWFHCCLQFA